MEAHAWNVTESAPAERPMQVVSGALSHDSGHSVYVPDLKIFCNGWGTVGSSHVIDGAVGPLPTRLELCWFSFAENAFYALDVELPQKDITERFCEGFENPLNATTSSFSMINVGVAPWGEVSLWLCGPGAAVEVASFVATQTSRDWRLVTSNDELPRRQYIERVLRDFLNERAWARLNEFGVPKGVYSSYRQRCCWKPIVVGGQPLTLSIRMLNGELEPFSYSRTPQAAQRATPKHAVLVWAGSTGNIFVSKLTFDEEETFAAFRKLADAHPDNQMVLDLECSDTTFTVDVSLRDDRFLLPLERVKVETFRRTR